MGDIKCKQDIEELVSLFYDRVLKDEMISPFFKGIDFKEHMPMMVYFWSFVLLDEPGYTTNVTDKHMHMQLNKDHFDRWLELFHRTVNQLFSGEKAEIAKQRATLIGWSINHKLSEGGKSIL